MFPCMNAKELGKMIYGEPTDENAEKAKVMIDEFLDNFKHIKRFMNRRASIDNTQDYTKIENIENVKIEGCVHKSPYGRYGSVDV